MFDDSRAFVSRPFLRGELELDYRAWAEAEDERLLERLRAWADRRPLKETSAEGAFIQTFFVDTWGYGDAGRVAKDQVTLMPKLRIAGEGAGGGDGEADLALGWFRDNPGATPQVLCEFKDIRSDLDARQNRKGGSRSPVEQCLNYVRGARRGLIGNEAVQPWWGLVTDMNEFRLYWWDRAPSQYLRFFIQRRDLLTPYDLLTPSEEARFDRFLFCRLFQRDQLLSTGGRPPLLRLIERQWVRERALEGEFYKRYKAVRERLFGVMTVSNPAFAGTPTQLLRLAQKLLDRFIFAFYCEDMGERMLFPPQFIRDYLQSRSREPFYDSAGDEVWTFFKRLFAAMNEGGALGGMRVPHINGGLFSPDADIESLALPNHVFAAAGQGANEATLERDPDTLLYLCARYNYAARGDARESLGLYTLGRIFEQSITELEYRAGELEGRESLAKLSKRKRDGVYYTPEWVVNYLVEGTLGPWFASAKSACGWPADGEALPDVGAVAAYEARLRTVRIVDPACGSGAFLIAAFRRLLDERLEVEREKARASGRSGTLAIDEAPLTAEILAGNIHGVDINPASLEIAKLALWLHSARANAPLSSLDHTLRCGNSLVGPDFWRGRPPADAAERERVNAFDWRAAFPEVWPKAAPGGFDIVLGNPPYVKLQNLQVVDPDVAAWLRAERGEDTYESARTGNFDLYLPFIEKGLRLLAPGGRMSFIAPSLWTVNQYGEGLRRLVRRTRQLERWIDFKAYQVFDEAITYTALQFFSRDPVEAVRIAAAPTGEVADIAWSDPDLAVRYDALPADGEWLMATGPERALIDRLAATSLRLDDPSLTSGIIVGIQTSADAVYHLERIARGRYRCRPKGAPAYEVEIEEGIMKPLVSGAEAKRYEDPRTDTYLLFPYERAGGVMRLMPESEMVRRFPRAWDYLRSWEPTLREREGNAFDDHAWWRFGRNQNIDKQDVKKMVVPRLVEHLKASLDESATIFLDNVDVGGVLAPEDRLLFLLGVVNGEVADFVFRRISKPFQGNFRSANKQFIAPLPIPDASPQGRAEVAAMARELQRLWTRRRDLIQSAAGRLSVMARAIRSEHWLLPDLPALVDLEARAPRALALAKRREWARERLAEAVAARLERLRASLEAGEHLSAVFAGGELSLRANGAALLDRIYLDDGPGAAASAYWNWLLLGRSWRDAGKLAAELRRPPVEFATPAATQFIARVGDLAKIVAEIAAAERAMNERLYDLYDLTEEERLLVENSGRSRAGGRIGHDRTRVEA